MSDNNVKCFLLVPAGMTKRSLRRYASAGPNRSGRLIEACPRNPGKYSCHDAMVALDVVSNEQPSADAWPHDDARWPAACPCGYVFQEDDPWQLFTEHLWKREDTSELMTLRDAPPGAMWYADWITYDGWLGPDGRALMAVCPGGGQWHIDGEASNCTRKGDKTHKSWVRHGTPPNITVDKSGATCNAGAGSIQTSNWHGFLRGGVFVKC